MGQHRFRELVSRRSAQPAAVSSGFVACPMVAFAPSQQASIAEVYRIAAERTREQFAAFRRYVAPTFSAN